MRGWGHVRSGRRSLAVVLRVGVAPMALGAVTFGTVVAVTAQAAQSPWYFAAYGWGPSDPYQDVSLGQAGDSCPVGEPCAVPDLTTPTSYEITTGGTESSVTVDDGYSLKSLLADSGIAQGANVIEVESVAGSILLNASQLTDDDPPPLVWDDSRGVYFADGNPADYLSDDSQSPWIDVSLYPGNRLQVAAQITSARVKAGQKVDLTASASGEEAGEQLTYTWRALPGAGELGTGDVFDRAFPSGSYEVYAEATGSDGSIGYSPTITFTVGSAPKGPSRKGGGTSKRKAAPTSGPGVKGSQTSTQVRGTTSANPAASAVGATTNAGHLARTAPAATAPTTPASRGSGSRRSPSRRSIGHGVRRSRAPGLLLSGTVLADPPRVANAAVGASHPVRAGAAAPARTGHLRRGGGGLGEDVWLALAALAAALAGGLLQDRGGRLLLRRIRSMQARVLARAARPAASDARHR